MMRLTLFEFAAAVQGELLNDVSDKSSHMVEGIVWDSRKIVTGCAFLALPGERVDGNDFIAEAARKGAAAIICTRMPDVSLVSLASEFKCLLIYVEDGTEALTRLAAAWRERLNARVVGITGSTGKTSTKDFCASVLSQRFPTTATLANQNNELGVPNTVLSANEDDGALIVEMGMRGRGQIERLCSFVKPAYAVITNIGVSHLELLGSRENIARAKAELLEGIPDTGTAVLNADDAFTPFLIEHARLEERGVRIITYGLSRDADVRAQDISYDDQGCARFALVLPKGTRAEAELRLPGAHNVSNALAAAALGVGIGLTAAEIARGLSVAEGSGMRMEVKHLPSGITVIDDAYNANPDSMRAALETLSGMSCKGKRIAVLGDMGELGPDELELHVQVGRQAAAAGLDMLICVGNLARGIAEGAAQDGMDVERIVVLPNVEDAVACVESVAQSGDIVLVKASHFMGFDQIVKRMA
ncbi:MAG: UDP-N-acetylmuramoyl-tripeptide--D-alanyl-D-alanine ligase [Coriobacteriales bacterium]|jgi:UDP-N-acetylmuramoyl-tripeptide--D-alanyl-D-alanine ligase